MSDYDDYLRLMVTGGKLYIPTYGVKTETSVMVADILDEYQDPIKQKYDEILKIAEKMGVAEGST